MRLLFILAFLASISQAFGQKEIETRQQAWFGYFNQTRFTNKSGLWADLHLRLTDNFLHKKSLSISRLGYTYYVLDNLRLTAGYGYVRQYSLNEDPDIPEHRPWQQIMWIEKKVGVGLMQYLRLEERFRPTVVNRELSEKYLFTWRFRYNISITIPLKGKEVMPKTPFFFLSDEVHINAGKNVLYNYFDQNRFFAGVGYQFSPTINAHFGYLSVFQQLPSASNYIYIDGIRLFVFHNLDLRQK